MIKRLRAPFIVLLLASVASSALAAPVVVRGGKFEADVSSSAVNRISVTGEKVVTVRSASDGGQSKMVAEADPAGDVYVTFDGDVTGREFTAFITMGSGRTVQAIMHPRELGAQNVVVYLPPTEAPAPSAAGGDDGGGIDPDGSGSPGARRREGYTEILTGLIRTMANGVAVEGVDRVQLQERPHGAGMFEIQPLEKYTVGDLVGTVLSIKNTSKVAQPLAARTFLVRGVLAASCSHEIVEASGFARLYIIEEARK